MSDAMSKNVIACRRGNRELCDGKTGPHAFCAPWPKAKGPSDEQVLAGFDSVRLTEWQKTEVDHLRDGFKLLAEVVLTIVPPSVDRTAALRELTRVSRDTVHAYTHNLPQEPDRA